MQTPICPCCGCSLVRLGISQKMAVSLHYQQKLYWFCCDGCLKLFNSNPEKCLNETSELVVCPVCLAEKPVNMTVEHIFNGTLFNFCHCPHCLDVFNQDQDYFTKRLAWQTNYAGIFGKQEGCCTNDN
ncbi:MAG: YHS domain-containing protein [Methyloprofundus sp.]|uniref:YHS domain-containing protein n=1 Tax=Methyloprofundus sp. TaxID=2020875 RepID=UPI002618A143|nr:YHS domain-containing protein [Methyloprofundus sp.]